VGAQYDLGLNPGSLVLEPSLLAIERCQYLFDLQHKKKTA